jgi:photosystem II stability/assembly factor-like uncharacterized protein
MLDSVSSQKVHMNRVAGFAVTFFCGLATLSTMAQLKGPPRLDLTPASPEEFVGGGPPGGDVCSILVDPRSSEILYAAVLDGGVFKSTNGGNSWTVASRGLPRFAGCDLAIDPANPATVYAEVLGRIYKTIDGGANWALTDSDLPEAGLPSIDPSRTDTLYTITQEGLFKSVNGGKDWQAVNSVGLPQDRLVSSQFLIDPSNSAILYVDIPAGVFKSYNEGKSWMRIDSGLLGGPNIYALAIDPAAPATLYASTQSGGVFKSTSGGESWKAANSGLPDPHSDAITTLLVDPSNSATVYAASDSAIFKSTQAGVNWQRITSGIENTFIRSLTIDPSRPSTLYAGTWRGVFKSTNAGASWAAADFGITRYGIGDLAVVDSEGKMIFARTNYGLLFKSADAGEHWTSVNGLPGGKVEDLTTDLRRPAILFAEVAGDIFESIDAGATWSAIKLGPVDLEKPIPEMDPTNPAVICAILRNRILYSTNGGGSWALLSPRIPNAFITRMWIDPTNSQNLYAGTFFSALYHSTDGGKTWNQVAGLPTAIRYFLLFDAHKHGTIYLWTVAGYIGSSEGDIYKSVDGGQNWTSIRIDASRNVPVDFLSIPSTDPTVMFAGIWTHSDPDSFILLKSINGGASWINANSGLPPQGVTTLVSSPENPSILYVGVGARGVFKSTDGGRSWKPTGSK